jgi:hypothetical protein
MLRTQIELTAEQHRRLHIASRRQGVSLTSR